MKTVTFITLAFLFNVCAGFRSSALPNTVKSVEKVMEKHESGDSTTRLVAQTGHVAPITCISYSHDGKLIATSDESSLILVRETFNFKVIWRFQSSQVGMVRALAWSQNDSILGVVGDRVFANDWDSGFGSRRAYHCTAWSIETGRTVEDAEGEGRAAALALRGDSAESVIFTDSRLTVGKQDLMTLPEETAKPLSLSSDGTVAAYLVAGDKPSGDSEIRMFDTKSNRSYRLPSSTMRSVALSPDGSKLIVWHSTGDLKIYRLPMLEVVAETKTDVPPGSAKSSACGIAVLRDRIVTYGNRVIEWTNDLSSSKVYTKPDQNVDISSISLSPQLGVFAFSVGDSQYAKNGMNSQVAVVVDLGKNTARPLSAPIHAQNAANSYIASTHIPLLDNIISDRFNRHDRYRWLHTRYDGLGIMLTSEDIRGAIYPVLSSGDGDLVLDGRSVWSKLSGRNVGPVIRKDEAVTFGSDTEEFVIWKPDSKQHPRVFSSTGIQILPFANSQPIIDLEFIKGYHVIVYACTDGSVHDVNLTTHKDSLLWKSLDLGISSKQIAEIQISEMGHKCLFVIKDGRIVGVDTVNHRRPWIVTCKTSSYDQYTSLVISPDEDWFAIDDSIYCLATGHNYGVELLYGPPQSRISMTHSRNYILTNGASSDFLF